MKPAPPVTRRVRMGRLEGAVRGCPLGLAARPAPAGDGGGFTGAKYIQSPAVAPPRRGEAPANAGPAGPSSVSARPAHSPARESFVTPFQAVVLSLVQAVTEFLPISSSGHLILVPYFLGWPDQGLSFDVAAHVGTMLAVVAYFRADVVELVSGFFSGAPGRRDFEPRRLGWALVVGTIPAALAGLALASTIETHLRQP